MDKKVLVVTPVYCTDENKRLHLLLENIYWTAQQKYFNMHHIIVNDGSTDKTPKILEKIARKNPHISVYHQENKGSSSAINFGVKQELKKFYPKYITILHSDDLLLPSSLENRVKLAEKTNSKFVYSDQVTFYENGGFLRLMRAKKFPNATTLYQSLLKHNDFPYPTMTWRLKFFIDSLNGFDESITSAEDWDIALRTANKLQEKNYKHSSINKITVAYRLHANNLARKNLKEGVRWQCYKQILKKHFKGNKYEYNLVKAAIRLYGGKLPTPIKSKIKNVRDVLLFKSPILPYKSEFLDRINEVNYQEALLS